jgi:hypothetical protein
MVAHEDLSRALAVYAEAAQFDQRTIVRIGDVSLTPLRIGLAVDVPPDGADETRAVVMLGTNDSSPTMSTYVTIARQKGVEQGSPYWSMDLGGGPTSTTLGEIDRDLVARIARNAGGKLLVTLTGRELYLNTTRATLIDQG